MPKIVLSGYYGFDNAGDEAVLLSIIQALKAVYNDDVSFVVLSGDPEATARAYGVEAVDRWKLSAVYRAIKSADLLVSGGGSLFQDATSNRTVFYYAAIVSMAKWLKKEIVFYAQGVGPLKSDRSRRIVQRAADKATHIFVRDAASKALLEEIGVTKAPIDVVMDPVVAMALSDEAWSHGVELLAEEVGTVEKPCVGFYLREWSVEGDFNERFAKIVEGVIALGVHPVFVPMHFPGDVTAALGVAEHLTKGTYTVINNHYTPTEILAITKALDYVVAMRLHGLIMAANAGTPFTGISYDPKIEAFGKALGYGQVFSVNPLDECAVRAHLEKQLKTLEAERVALESQRPQFYEKAIEPAKRIREILS